MQIELSAKEKYSFNKLQKRLRRNAGQAIADFNMIEEGDRVMVCMSGGKDSYTMLDILLSLQASAPVSFQLVAVNLDHKMPGFPEEVLPNYLKDLGIEYHIIEEDTHSIIMEKITEGKSVCSLCSRLRRGILYRVAQELRCNKLALGHHREDILETLLLNMFYGGKLKSMPPKLVSDDGRNVVIRPLAYCKEKDIIRYSQIRAFPIIEHETCVEKANVQRPVIKEMLREWDRKEPGRIESMFRALSNVIPSHLLDHNQFDFKSLNSSSGFAVEDEGFEPEIAPMELPFELDQGDRLNVIELEA